MVRKVSLDRACRVGSFPFGTGRQADSNPWTPSTQIVTVQLTPSVIVSYDVSGDEGELVVKQGSAGGSGLSGDARNEWDVSLNDEVPTDLGVQMGAGESDLDLDSLTLKGLDLQMGAGKTTIDLTGDYAQSFDASIEGGVGEATVLLPSEVGVKAKAEGGLGKINAEGLKRVGDS